MTPDYDCLIAYLEARRDMQSWTDEEWDVATCVIDWLKSQLEELVTGPCDWTYDDLYDFFETACGESFIIFEGGPQENKMIYCPFCGKSIKETDHE